MIEKIPPKGVSFSNFGLVDKIHDEMMGKIH